jgi:Tol biopolymer transport system component
MTPDQTKETPLESWKEIAAYLQRNNATVRRWEKEEGLPVHRHSHTARSSVYAYPSEIDAWRAGRVVAETAPTRPTWWRPVWAGVTALLCLVMVGNGIRPVAAQSRGTAKATRQIWSVDGIAEFGSISLDGRYLAYGDGDVFVRDLKKGETHRLAHHTETEFADVDVYVILSPDGSQVAYTWYDTSNAHSANKFSLRILPRNSENGKPRILHSTAGNEWEWPFAWSPDGKQLFVVREMADHTLQFATVSLQDGSFKTIKSIATSVIISPALSPDGRFIAYSAPPSGGGKTRDIFVLAADGSRETAVVENPADDSEPVWSADGSRIVFLSDRTGNASLWTVPIKDGRPVGAPELLKADVGALEPTGITRNGDFYYYIHMNRRNIWTAELGVDGKAAKPAEPAIDHFVNSNGLPSWSPDGQYLAYYSFRGQGIGSGPTVLVVRTLKTGEEREITSRLVIERLYDGAAPKWFPGGGSVLVVMGRSANSGMGLLSSRPHEWQYRAPALSLWQPAGPFARRKNHLS